MQHSAVPQGIFKAKPTAIETKQDVTTKVAHQIINNEAAARDRKTERLRLARLAKEAADASQPVAPKRTARRKQA